MTGDKIDPATMIFRDKSDLWVAGKVRMLMRDDLDHENVCCGARDRIMFLSQEIERLNKLLPAVAAEAWRWAVNGTDDPRNEPKPREATQAVIDAVIMNARMQLEFEIQPAHDATKERR